MIIALSLSHTVPIFNVDHQTEKIQSADGYDATKMQPAVSTLVEETIQTVKSLEENGGA